MNKAELLQILKEMNITPGKKFGQNFMFDNNLLDFIIREAHIHNGDLILEIGPGCGALTRKILNQKVTLIAIEIDKRLCDYLSSNLKNPDFILIQGDACRMDLHSVLKDFSRSGEKLLDWKCIANIPYSISGTIIVKLLEMICPPMELLLLLQKETGQRLAAVPGTKNYGSLSVRVQTVFDVELIRIISPSVFFPQPDVESALVRFKRKESIPESAELRHLSITVKAAFSQRRKKMIKALSAVYGKEKTQQSFEMAGVNPDARAEELSPPEFRHLSGILNN